MRQKLPKWREVLLMFAGGAVAALLFWLVTGKGADAHYGSTAIVAGVLIGSFPYALLTLTRSIRRKYDSGVRA